MMAAVDQLDRTFSCSRIIAEPICLNTLTADVPNFFSQERAIVTKLSDN